MGWPRRVDQGCLLVMLGVRVPLFHESSPSSCLDGRDWSVLLG